jgi:hypothetical protein
MTLINARAVAVLPVHRDLQAPLIIRARVKAETPVDYPTRLIEHLPGFRPPDRPIPLSRFGGWAERRVQPTGFFRPLQVDGRWWLVDPDGCLFIQSGVNAVAAGTSRNMRQALRQRFGTEQAWAEHAAAQLHADRFNGIGCWSDEHLLRATSHRPVYAPIWNFMSEYGALRGGVTQESGHKGYPNQCIFVFDPEFEVFCDLHARQLASTRDDPYLLGHFSDNELPFPNDLLDRYLAGPSDDPGRIAAVNWLDRQARHRHRPIDQRELFRAYVVSRYLEIVAAAIRRYDPNHLFLGPRFYNTEKDSAAVFRAAGKHLDVIAVNLYRVWTPGAELRRWAEWSGRPLLITEWYAKGEDSGLTNRSGAGFTVATQEQRGQFYQNFTLALLQSRVVVAWHWFKYMDNDPADPDVDPSNADSNKGIVNIAYEPYEPLLQRMRELNHQIYPLAQYFDALEADARYPDRA